MNNNRLKFRAWDNKNNEWINEVVYLSQYGNPYILEDYGYNAFKEVEVDATISFSTGHCDKTHLEIYSGDILKGFNEEIKYYEIRLEEWEFVVYNKFGRWGILKDFIEFANKHISGGIIIIGNIFNHPHLIEKL